MQQALPAAAALLLVFWLLRRRKSSLPSSDDGSAVAAINRTQLVRLLEPAVPAVPAPAPITPLPVLEVQTLWPTCPQFGTRLDPRRRRQVLAELRAAAAGSTGERLAAVAACLTWGDRASLPMLRRARFDPDLRVAALAAEGIAAFRGRPAAAAELTQPARLPRNVARTL